MIASRREKFSYYNNLSGLIKSLENVYTLIDLRNDCFLTGKISRTDGFMNIEMEDVILHDRRNNLHSFEYFYIKTRNIRYVHIPENMKTVPLLTRNLQEFRIPKEPNKRLKELKYIRAKRYTEQIVKEAYDN